MIQTPAKPQRQYRYDELNRLTEATRYDRDGVAAAGGVAGSTWKLAARQCYGYDASNTRRVKETVPVHADDPPDAIALYVLPGDLERRGLVRSVDALSYQASATLGTETQYLVAGARIVWYSPCHGLRQRGSSGNPESL